MVNAFAVLNAQTESPAEARQRILRDVETGVRAFNRDQLVRELTAGKCVTAADEQPAKPGDICPCCCRLVGIKDRVAILNGIVRHEGCR